MTQRELRIIIGSLERSLEKTHDDIEIYTEKAKARKDCGVNAEHYENLVRSTEEYAGEVDALLSKLYKEYFA